MQMKRYPHGVEGEFFYQKRVPVPHPDWLETVHILFPGSGRTADFPVVTNAAGARVDQRTSAASSCTRGTAAWTTSSGPTTCSSTSIRARAIRGSTCREIAVVVKRADGRAGPPELSEDVGRDGAATSSRRSGPSSASPRCGGSPRHSRRRSSGGSTTRTWRRRRGRWPTGAASSSTTARTRATGRSRPPTRSGPTPGRPRLGATRVGRGAGRRAGGVHASDDARPGEEGRRPHRRDVEAEGEPRFRASRSSASSRSTSDRGGRRRSGRPSAGCGCTWSTVHCSGSLSGRKRRKLEPWRKRPFCHLS